MGSRPARSRRAAEVEQEPDPDPAPNLRGSYPLAGARLGPAWREAWRVLGTGEWVSVRTLCLDVAPRHGLSPQALDAVLRAARSLPAKHPARLEAHRGPDRLIAVRRADLSERALAEAPSTPPAAALNGMFVGAPVPVALTHADGAPLPEEVP